MQPQNAGQKTIRVSKREINVTGYRWGDELTVWQDQYGVTVLAESAAGKTILTQYGRRPEPKAHD
jgi:hypothetical protein